LKFGKKLKNRSIFFQISNFEESTAGILGEF